MGLDDSPIFKIISAQFKLIDKFFEMCYKNNWLMYLVIILIIGAIWIMFFN